MPRALPSSAWDSARDASRGAQPDAKRRRQGAGAQAAFLPAAVDQRFEPHPRPAADIEGADALGRVHLVAGDRHQVDLHRLHVEPDLAGGLRGVGVEQRALARASVPISASGWITPISLCAARMETSAVRW